MMPNPSAPLTAYELSHAPNEAAKLVSALRQDPAALELLAQLIQTAAGEFTEAEADAKYAPLTETLATLTSAAGATAINLANGPKFKLTLSENSTLAAPTNAVEGRGGLIHITQGAGGSHTLAYNAFWEFGDGNTPPALSTTAGKVDVLSYEVLPGGLKARVQLSKAEA